MTRPLVATLGFTVDLSYESVPSVLILISKGPAGPWRPHPAKIDTGAENFTLGEAPARDLGLEFNDEPNIPINGGVYWAWSRKLMVRIPDIGLETSLEANVLQGNFPRILLGRTPLMEIMTIGVVHGERRLLLSAFP